MNVGVVKQEVEYKNLFSELSINGKSCGFPSHATLTKYG